MKKWIAVFLVLVCMFSLAACGSSTSTTSASSSTTSTSSQSSTSANVSSTETAVDSTVEHFSFTFLSSWAMGENLEAKQFELTAQCFSDATDGIVTAEILGGTELFDNTVTASAVGSGAADACGSSISYHGGLVTAAYAIGAMPMTTAEMRESGVYDILEAAYNEQNLHLLFCRDESAWPFVIYTCDKITSLDDLQGMRLRTSAGTASAVAAAMGATPVTLGNNEIYSALEQGMIDGFTSTLTQLRQESYLTYCKCLVMPGFLRGGSVVLMNLDVWNSYTDEQKALIEKGCALAEEKVKEFQLANYEESLELFYSMDGEVFTASGEEQAKLESAAYKAAWDYAIEQNPVAAEMKELFEAYTSTHTLVYEEIHGEYVFD